MCSVSENPTAENPTSDDAHPPGSQSVQVTKCPERPRPAKAALLPEIARLSLEGHSSRAIGGQLGVPRRTVDRWLRELRQQWAASAAENAGELFAVAMARLESVYREAMEAWRRSLADKQTSVETLGSDGEAKPKSTLRKTTQSGQAAFLGKAIQAAKEIFKFQSQHLDAVCESQETARCRARQELVDELRGLPKEVFREIKELVRQGGGGAPRRSPNELAAVLSSLTAEEYSKLGKLMWCDSKRELPPRGRVEYEGLTNEDEG